MTIIPITGRAAAPLRGFLLVLCGLAAVGPWAERGRAAEGYAAVVTRLIDDYRSELEELAAWCDERNLADQALETRRWFRPADPSRLFVPVLPEVVGPPPPPEGASDDVVQWHKTFLRLRSQQAGEYFTLARKAVKTGQASLAFDLIMAALREDPDHKAIRQLLGFRQYKGQWLTNYELQRARRSYVWDDRFGWLPRRHVEQYEQGKRYYRGQWISADEDVKIHASIANGWVIQTEHYNILTNRGIEEAVALGAKLEGLYRVWKQLFVRYYASEREVAGLFEGRAATIQLPQHNIVYFRDRKEYVETLRPNSANIDISLGIYIHGPTVITRNPAVYFFAGEDSDQTTLFHEAVHQLFHESRKVDSGVGQAGNFWIIEAVAMYFESLKEEEGSYVLGGFDAQRLLDARYRLLESKFYIPLADFCRMTIADIQGDPRIGMIYSQAAGLGHFLIHYDSGRYRDALVAYLDAVYAGRDTPETLSRLTGETFEQLDRQYVEFMTAAAP